MSLIEGERLEQSIKRLERERVKQKEDNIKLGRYIEVFAIDDEGITYCSIGTKGLGHPLGGFEVGPNDWERLEKAYTNAGYKIHCSIEEKD